MTDMQKLLDIAAKKREQAGTTESGALEKAEGFVGIVEKNVVRDSSTEVTGEDGLLHCAKCGGKRQTRIEIKDEKAGTTKVLIVPCICDCMKEADERKRTESAEKEELERLRRLKAEAFADIQMAEFTFEKDDKANPKISSALKTYCDNFPRFRREGKGIILYGSVGTGKSFLAACVVNELVSKGYACQMTTFSRLTNQIGALWDGKQEFIDRLTQLSLIAIDDLGVERDTEYMNENVTTIVDALYTAKVPMIITSNYTPKQMTEEMDIRRKRIFDRILERCHPIEVTGESRRKQMGRNDYLEMKKMLGV